MARSSKKGPFVDQHLVKKVEADKNRCFELANSFSLDIDKPEADPIYLGLKEVTLRFPPRPSKWLTEFPNLSMVISQSLGENNSLSSNDSTTIQKKSIQAETKVVIITEASSAVVETIHAVEPNGTCRNSRG